MRKQRMRYTFTFMIMQIVIQTLLIAPVDYSMVDFTKVSML